MPRLIDANELLKKAFGKRYGLIHTSEINKMPTVDAVPVVRCGFCKNWDDFPIDTIDPEYHLCKRLRTSFPAYGFCIYGERKDEGMDSGTA